MYIYLHVFARQQLCGLSTYVALHVASAHVINGSSLL